MSGMKRRFQFGLRAVMVVMLVVAVACAIWVKLSLAAKAVIVGAPLGVLMWLADWGVLDILLGGLLPPYGSQPPQDGPRYVIKWRRRRRNQNDQNELSS
jgi:hypothetical protein